MEGHAARTMRLDRACLDRGAPPGANVRRECVAGDRRRCETRSPEGESPNRRFAPALLRRSERRRGWESGVPRGLSELQRQQTAPTHPAAPFDRVRRERPRYVCTEDGGAAPKGVCRRLSNRGRESTALRPCKATPRVPFSVLAVRELMVMQRAFGRKVYPRRSRHDARCCL